MKRHVAVLLFVCSLCAFTMTAFAADIFSFTNEDWMAAYGIPEPQREDYADSESYNAAWDSWYAGFSAYIFQQTQAEYARREEVSARQAAQAALVDGTFTESAGTKNEDEYQPVDDGAPAKYPVGSYVDPAGVVWSPNGTRLSPVSALAESPAENAGLSSSDLDNQADLSPAADPDTLAVIAGLVSEIAEDQPVWYVEDLRPSEPPAEVLTGLKSLVTSVFGEYTPVTTTSVVTETVGNDTHQYLVETVAPGAAGVDYEWLAGVFLFGILLFCLMKLLGGVLK